jgi:hypothetical protein
MLNFIDAPEFATTAVNGDGILEVLRAITQTVLSSVAAQQPAPQRAEAKGARQQVRTTKSEPIGIASSLSAATAGLLGTRGSEPRPLPARPPASAPGWTIVPGPATDAPQPERAATAKSAPSGVSFARLWPAERAEAVRAVERLIATGDFAAAVSGTAKLIMELLDELPYPQGADRSSKVALLDIDGREYLQLCRLAAAPREGMSERDALFALHVLVAAHVKAAGV